MMISIIITVKNESEGMEALLDSLLMQEKPFEIIIVDANSTDGTQDIVKRLIKNFFIALSVVSHFTMPVFLVFSVELLNRGLKTAL